MTIDYRQRIAKYGEIFTPPWLVDKMIDLVKHEVDRVDSFVFEPACGHGNFLVPMLARKLKTIRTERGYCRQEKEEKTLFALSRLYGIELLADNVAICRQKLLHMVATFLDLSPEDSTYQSAATVIYLNIVHGNALTSLDNRRHPIIFFEWKSNGSGFFRCRSFRFSHLVSPTTQRPSRRKINFDVIIGNPPYQLPDKSNSASASPIYQKFVEQAIALKPKYLTMVTPSRWFASGKGLDRFRKTMLADRHLRAIVDYIVDKDVFSNVNINGGVNYFLWVRDKQGDCSIMTVDPGGKEGPLKTRRLDEFDVLVRRNHAALILRKVLAWKERYFHASVLSSHPFGLRTYYRGPQKQSRVESIKIHGSGRVSWVTESALTKNLPWLWRWKVLLGRATDGNERYPLPIWDRRGPFIAGPGEACTETYLVAYVCDTYLEAQRVVTYMRTKFFRFLVSLRKCTQHNKADVFRFVPLLSMDREWTDDALQQRYKLTDADMCFIGKMIQEISFTG